MSLNTFEEADKEATFQKQKKMDLLPTKVDDLQAQLDQLTLRIIDLEKKLDEIIVKPK